MTKDEVFEKCLISRKRTCERCGCEVYEKPARITADAYGYEEVFFEKSGFGTIVIVPYDLAEWKREEITLCPECANKLLKLYNSFCAGG